ncbi:MAG TPA: tripartite tricarboxylate transporter substrate binding protein, partial [Burkholderiales bacterium]|nr:tripartite tricarboxylate transporter substrate binding protein [Burkholderiales bacterium]
LTAALLCIAGVAAAQTYPVKPIRMLIGFAPGGGTDIVGRIVAQKLGEALGHQVIADNRAGASGQLAAELVAKAAPDGYTIMMAHIAAISILPSLSKLPYDPLKDFAPISLAAIGPNLLVVHPSLPVRSVKELIALAKARPGELQFASAGAGTVQHLAGELFKLQAKVDMLHVPYKGSGQSIVDLIAGQVHMDFDSVPPVINYVRQGRLRALAVTSAKRFSLLPDIRTIEESGVPGFDMSTWWGLVAPAAMGKDAIGRLQTETVKLLRQPDVKEKIAFAGAETVGNTPEEFAAYIRTETAKYARIVKAANIKLE